MKISLSHKPFTTSDADTIVVFTWQSDEKKDLTYGQTLTAVTAACGGVIIDIAQSEGFDGSIGKVFLVHTHGKITAKKVLLAGLGVQSDISVASLQKTGAAIARRLKDSKAIHADLFLDTHVTPSIPVEKVVQSVAEGLYLGAYQFTHHKTVGKEKDHFVSSCTLGVPESEIAQATKAVQLATIVTTAVSFTRDLVNEPPSVTTPTYLANVAKELVQGKEGMACDVFGKSDLEKMKMGGILGIARGTDVEPKFIKLEYRGGGNKTVVLIGKGITFDTGGLSLKPANSMETMKLDMAGAAAVLGVFSALDALRPKITVIGLISATENMPGPNAVKPGDIVTAMNGKTIEILNTDAEGRVVLADALSYAVSKIKPDVMIDLATLTGACVVALGEEVTGLFSNSQPLADALLHAARQEGEALWQLPLVDAYRDQIKSTIADIKNIGAGRWGGAITAALFLQEFTDSAIPWAHLDIAGPAFAEKDMVLSPCGGTGHGVRLLLSYILNQHS